MSLIVNYSGYHCSNDPVQIQSLHHCCQSQKMVLAFVVLIILFISNPSVIAVSLSKAKEVLVAMVCLCGISNFAKTCKL